MSKVVPAFAVVNEFTGEIISVHYGYTDVKPFVDGIGIGTIETTTYDGVYQQISFHLKETGGKLFENDNGHEFIDYFLCDRAAVYDKRKYYFIDKENKVISKKYDGVNRFINNYAIVRNNEKWGLIDINGVEVIEPKYDYIRLNQNIYEVFVEDEVVYRITLKQLSEILISFVSDWED